ncbi:lipopolysaccharide biosynthesis protein [Tenuifilum thalassicum]|uniref:Oligosaccharide flippase family protein n=1 Tax=Tenuifilum thalassicum TaxID=2590900 RepID=A0A7D4BID9_9BACT|nr:oligosaccharide flippase family protein [Tenuifilum thalassicum]QKG78719.1 oligosaccharide flippase family protein [Tenuifilum thalassicum]
MSSVKQLYSQSIIYGLSTVVPRLLNYLLVPIHTNVLTDPRQYGIITEFYAYISFILILLTFGLETGFFRFINKNTDKKDEVYSNSFYFISILSLTFFFLSTIFSTNLSNFLGTNYLPIYIITAAAIVSLDAITAIPFAKLRSQNRPIIFSMIKIIGVAINVLLNILFYLVIDPSVINKLIGNINPLYFVFVANLIQNIVVLILVFVYAKLPTLHLSKSLLIKLIKYSFPILLAGIAGTTNEAFDRIFIKYLLPKDLDSLYYLGIYGACIKISVLLVLFIQMYRFAAEPFFFKTAVSDNHNELFSKSFKYFIIFTIVISIAITFNLPILKYFIGKNYRESLYIIPIMLAANVFYGIFFNLSFWYKLSDKTIYGLKYSLIGSGTTILSNIILIPVIGIFGAAVSRFITYTIMSLLSYRDGKTSGYISLEKKNLFLYLILLAIIIFIGAIFLIQKKEIFSLIITNILLFIFVLLFAYKEKLIRRHV